jgi:hypothetical protein
MKYSLAQQTRAKYGTMVCLVPRLVSAIKQQAYKQHLRWLYISPL